MHFCGNKMTFLLISPDATFTRQSYGNAEIELTEKRAKNGEKRHFSSGL
jgi:hypothetical protein